MYSKKKMGSAIIGLRIGFLFKQIRNNVLYLADNDVVIYNWLIHQEILFENYIRF